MFKLDLTALNSMVVEAKGAVKARESLRGESHDAVMELTESGFVGDTHYASMEAFNTWINCFDDTSDVLNNFCIVLEQALETADELCDKRDKVPSYIGAYGGYRASNCGELILGDNYESVANNIENLVNIDYADLEKTLSSAKAAAGMLAGGGGIRDAIATLEVDITSQKQKLTSFGWAYSVVANSIVEFDAHTAASFTALENGDVAALENALGVLGFLGQNSDALMEIGAGAVWVSGEFANPKAIKVRVVLDPVQLRVSGYVRDVDGLSGRYKPSSVVTNSKLAKLVAFKALSKIATPLTVVIGVVDAVNSYDDEYNRNPYLPEGVRNYRSNAAVDVSVVKTVVTVGVGLGGAAAGAAFGAAAGIAAGPAGVIVGAIVGLVVGSVLDVVSSSDPDGDGKTLTDDYIDWRTDAYIISREQQAQNPSTPSTIRSH